MPLGNNACCHGELFLQFTGRKQQRDTPHIANVDSADCCALSVLLHPPLRPSKSQILQNEYGFRSDDSDTCRVLRDVCSVEFLRNLGEPTHMTSNRQEQIA